MTVIDPLKYSRHFSLLSAFATLTYVLSRISFPASLSVAFAFYGALHAAALILSLRVPPAAARSALFAAAAAALSALMFHLGILGTHLSASLPGELGSYVVLGLASVAGVITYGVSIRMFGLYRLTGAALAVISLGCASASCVASLMLTQFPLLGPWWLAVAWWYAFSGSLWLCHRREDTPSSLAGG
jgi:hypothetical protein